MLYGKVVNLQKGDMLNIRDSWNVSGEIVGKLYEGQTIQILEELENGWVKLKGVSVTGYVGMFGYVNGHYIEKVKLSKYTPTEPINIRSDCSWDIRKILQVILPGETIELVDYIEDDFWALALFDGYCGYVPYKYIKEIAPSEPSVPETDNSNKIEEVIKVAKRQIGKPYEYGAIGENSFDCSGLMMYCFDKIGIKLPRTSRQQALEGEEVIGYKPKRGDLLFFDCAGNGNITHCGLYLGDNVMLHSPSSGKTVEVTNLSPYWKRTFRTARRIIK